MPSDPHQRLDPAHHGLDPAPALWATCDAWLRRSTEIISDSADALNAINVFPVSDSDTGSNLKLTLRGVAGSVPEFNADSLDQVMQAAILSAHGNSGAILAEMFTSVCRTLERGRGRLKAVPAGAMIAVVMQIVARAATQAVARPVAGTILTVADEAALAAERAAALAPADARTVAEAARRGAQLALDRTPEQLEVLARAGVVDAGGQAFVLLLDVLVEVLGGQRAEALAAVEANVPRAVISGQAEQNELEYEVMYALRGARKSALDLLRDQLSELGTSVVIVGDESVAQVHVHLSEPGAALEAALGVGTISRIRITALEAADPVQMPAGLPEGQRSVISLVAGSGLADAVTAMGGTALQSVAGQAAMDQLVDAVASMNGELVILPNDMENLEVARHVADQLRAPHRRIAVIPTVAQVQGLAAIAVHEPSADFDSVVVAMSTAAGHARHGAVTIAESSAMTMAGRCEIGDVLGIVDGDFVEIGSSVVEVAWQVIERLLAPGGELLTLVSGVEADTDLVSELHRRVRHSHDAVDVEAVEGGQQRYLLLVGLE